MAVKLRLTVQDVHTRESGDIEVDASADSSLTSVLSALPGEPDGRACFVGATRLDPGSRLADSPLLPGAVLSVGGVGPDYQPVRGGAAGTLHVISGPDAGFGAALRPGRRTIGRSASADVSLHDVDASRQHAVIEVAPDGSAAVWDAGSTNGTFVNGIPAESPMPLGAGNVLQIGADQLRWTPGATRSLRVEHTDDGRLEFDRVFTPAPALREGEVDMPSGVPAGRNIGTIVMSSMVGLASGVVLAVAAHQTMMLAVSALGVAAPLVTFGLEGGKRRKEVTAVEEARQTATARVAALAEEEDRLRRQLTPGPAEIVDMVSGARPDLWSRNGQSPQGLAVRVGRRDQAPSIRLHGEPWEGFALPVLRDVPVALDLRTTGVLGVIGSGEEAHGLLRWLIVQLAALRSPDDLRFVLLTAGTGEDIEWARWLPHLDAGNSGPAPCWIGNTDASRTARIDELKQLIAARQAERGAAQVRSSEVVVVLDGALALRNLPGIHDILRQGPDVGVYALCADTQGIIECRGLCEVAGEREVRITTPNGTVETAIPEAIDAALADQIARGLAPMRDRVRRNAESAIPYPVRLLDELGIRVPTADDIRDLWGRNEGPTTRVLLGADASGPVYADLALQGPHTMLAGATGAGKSVLLQTLVTSLLLANRPDELNLVLVDFKGGGAFLPFEHCPHVTALITSTGFGEADAARVLASVRAEVGRREALLARFGAEIDNYWRARKSQPDLPPLPRLVMIFDEFARVLETSPNFLKELVNVAAKGRSLGMHLVLATQSLQGKLSPELKNNIDLRISLRQNEPAESTEVLDAPDAADIPGALKGRGMILCTHDERKTPRAFQSGYLGAPPPDDHVSPVTVRALRWAELGTARPSVAAHSSGTATDQDLAIAAIEEVSRTDGLEPPFRALLPPLPETVALERLEDLQTSTPPASAAAFGLADEPELQAQSPFYLDLAANDRLLVAGGPQSGRTTFARALITSIATRFRPDKVHLYVVEHQPAGLSDFADLPHCGGVFSPAEPDRIRRLVEWLAEETQRRAAVRFEPGGRDNPVIVVVVDGWEQFESRSDPTLADVSLGPALRDVMAIGAPLGLHVVAIGGQDLLTGKVPALCNQRLLLPFPNEDARRAHVRGGMALPPSILGRAIDASTGRHVQICQPETSAAEVVAGVLASQAPGVLDAAGMPRQFPSLPSQISVADLVLPQPLRSKSWIPLGVGGPDTATIGVDLFDVGPHLLLISGPPRSGRTTAIATLARLLSWNGIGVLALAPPQSPLGQMVADEEDIKVVTAVSIEDSALREAAESFADRRYAVLLDDADRITVQAEKQGFSEGPTLLDDIAPQGEFGRRALIIAGNASPIISGNRRSLAKVTKEILMSGTCLLLAPAKRADARELGMNLEPDQYFTRPAGRGYLATVPSPTLVQLATSA